MTSTDYAAETPYPDPIPLPSETPLNLAYLPGTGDRLVIAIAGVGKGRGNVQPFELVGTASDHGKNHVLLVADPLRCWMNHPDYAAELKAQIEAMVEVFSPKEVVALGNSMGGFMAIHLADIVPIDTVIALTPQYSVHPELVPEETRWQHYRGNIKTWLYPDIGKMAAPGTTYFVFHGDSPGEQRHWRHLPKDGNLYHFILSKSGHRLAFDLKKRNVLNRIIIAAMDHRPRILRKVLERRGASRFKPHYRIPYEAMLDSAKISRQAL